MLYNDFIKKLVYVSCSEKNVADGQEFADCSQSRPKVVVIRSLSPGLSSYSVFVEALRGGGADEVGGRHAMQVR